MQVELNQQTDAVTITLSEQEARDIVGGAILAGPHNPYSPDAKVEVRPLSEIDPSYRHLPATSMLAMSRLREVACRAVMFSNNDLIVYVPEDLAESPMIDEAYIPSASVQAPPHVAPAGGIHVIFE